MGGPGTAGRWKLGERKEYLNFDGSLGSRMRQKAMGLGGEGVAAKGGTKPEEEARSILSWWLAPERARMPV